MAFPTQQVSTNNLDSSADDPSLARADLLLAVQNLNTIVSEAGGAGGVALLDGSAKLQGSQMPAAFSPSQNLTLSPTTGVVKIEDVLRLQALTTDSVLLLTDNQACDIVYVTDGDSGDPCLAVYANNSWNVIPFNSGTIAKDVQAVLTTTALLVCAPE